MRARTCALFILWVAIFLLPACGTTAEVAPDEREALPLPEEPLKVDTTGQTGGTLRAALLGSPSTFNFVMVRDLRSLMLSALSTATLLEFDRGEKMVRGGIVKDWEVSEDGRSFTLHLRRGVRFSDGVPLTADDVVFTFERIYEEGSQNPLRDSLVVGGEPLEVRKLDEHSVEIVCAEQYAALDYILTTVPVLPKHRLSDPGKKIDDYWHLDSSPQEMAGLGPFILDQHVPGRFSRYRYNPHYWRVDSTGRRLPYLDYLEVHFIEDRNSQVLRLQSGELDLLLDPMRPQDFLRIQEIKQGVRAINAGPGSRLDFCWFNLNTGRDASGRPFLEPTKKRWFSDIRFRRAVNRAISRNTIAENVFLGQARPAHSLVPNSIPTWYASELDRPSYDPDESRRLLREAGYRWRNSGRTLVDPRGTAVKFTILTINETLWGRMAAVIQQDLAKLGMEITIRQEELRAAISRIARSRDYDMALMALDFPADPADHVSVLLSSADNHFWNPRQDSPETEWEARIDELMFEQTHTIDLEARRRLYIEVQRILAENVPLIPLVNRDILVGARDRIGNLEPTSLSPYTLWNVWELWVDSGAS